MPPPSRSREISSASASLPTVMFSKPLLPMSESIQRSITSLSIWQRWIRQAHRTVSFAHGLRRLRRLRPAAAAFHRRVQLPAAAPGHRGAGAGRPLLPRGAAGARGGREGRRLERAATGAGEAAAEAVLPGGTAGRSGRVDRGRRRAAERESADGRRETDDRDAEGERR